MIGWLNADLDSHEILAGCDRRVLTVKACLDNIQAKTGSPRRPSFLS